MFGFRLVHKRELALYAATIDELHREKRDLTAQVEQERRRADAVVNALLIKKEQIAITPTQPLTEAQEEQMMQKTLNIFGDDTITEKEFMERLQHDS